MSPRTRLWLTALPPFVLVLAAAYASIRAVLSAAEIALVQQGSVLPAIVTAQGGALGSLAAAVAMAMKSTFGDGALTLRLPALAISFALMVAVARIATRRASPAAGAWAALAFLTTGSFVQFFDARLLVLPPAMLACALVAADAMGEGRRGALPAFVVSALATVYLDVSYVFAVMTVCLAFVLESKRQRTPMTAVIVVAIFNVGIGIYRALSSGGVGERFARLSSISAVLHQPFYALAFLQSTYGRALGLLVPAILLLLPLSLFVRHSTTAAPESLLRRFIAPVLLTTLPVWAFAPLWILGSNVSGPEVMPVSIGCCVLLGIAADTIGATGHRRLFAAGTAVLVLLALASAGMRDPAVTLKRDLDEHRSRFVVLDWERGLDDGLPILVASEDVYVQLAHYAPAPLARRIAYVNPSSREADAFVAEHRTFYVFEGSEVRSPLLAWLAHRGLTLSQSRSFVPRDQSIDAAAFLYRVDLD